MRIDVLTLFPESFAPLAESIIGRAQANGLLELNIKNIRDLAEGKHKITDDRLYGGGAGMVLKPEPIFACVEQAKIVAQPRIIVTSPQGKVFDQAAAAELSAEEQLIFICGHYEGIDERVMESLATDVYSIGDFVLTGGEIPAMAMIDSIVRLREGVLGHAEAAVEESFNQGLLEYPQYTRPPEFRGMEVPATLLSGDHAAIAKWRRQKSLERTLSFRPDLLEQALLTETDCLYLAELRQKVQKPFRLYVALVHYPVYNKKKHVIATSMTNLDLHDIARAAATFGVEGFYIVQPQEGQRQMTEQLLEYWRSPAALRYNPDRAAAFESVRLKDNLSEVVAELGQKVKIITTGANLVENITSYKDMRCILQTNGGDYLLLFGTGFGLTDELTASADYRLRPLYGNTAYNHLSVRSAASIVFDRLLGESNAR